MHVVFYRRLFHTFFKQLKQASTCGSIAVQYVPCDKSSSCVRNVIMSIFLNCYLRQNGYYAIRLVSL